MISRRRLQPASKAREYVILGRQHRQEWPLVVAARAFRENTKLDELLTVDGRQQTKDNPCDYLREGEIGGTGEYRALPKAFQIPASDGCLIMTLVGRYWWKSLT